jgi:hypothetical protein
MRTSPTLTCWPARIFAVLRNSCLPSTLTVAAGHHHLAGAAAVAQAHQLQQLVELDKFPAQFETDFLHFILCCHDVKSAAAAPSG